MFLALLAGFLVSCENSERNTPPIQSEPVFDFNAWVTFLDTEGSEISEIEAAVADDDKERASGLMNVKTLGDDQGMIFLFEQEEPRSFWMMNTFLSLDIIYVNARMEIVRIHRYTTPFSQEGLLSEKPAKYVVEVKAGYTSVHDINEGDMISFRMK